MTSAGELGRWPALAAAAVVAVALPMASPPAFAADAIAAVHYGCSAGKTIAATYYADRVDLVLSDGRKLALPQTMAASGIRYADAGETIVFWSKGKTAFITEGSAETYADCEQR